jgi:hypothetical protein
MDSRICQTFTATPAEPGGLLRGARPALPLTPPRPDRGHPLPKGEAMYHAVYGEGGNHGGVAAGAAPTDSPGAGEAFLCTAAESVRQ